MKILVTPASFKKDSESPAMEMLRNFADSLVFNPEGRPLNEDELIPLLEGCSGCIAGLDSFSAKVMEKAGNLKVISRYGTGYDKVDIAAAKAKNIIVCNTPGVNSRAVADLAFALLLSCARKVHVLDRKLRNGEWARSIGTELHGKTLGILGLGAVGKETAKRAAGFSMNVLSYDPFIDKKYAQANGIIPVDFEKLISDSDFLSLHLPLTDDTRNIISRDTMQKMKRGAVIINTARGGLIDEDAAFENLNSGSLGALALDVYEEEPLKKSRFFDLENVVMTPHTAAHTKEAVLAMAEMSVKNLIDVLEGRDCPHIL